MINTLSQLLKIIKHRENYASTETYLAHIEQKTVQIITELEHIQKVRFKKGKFWCSNLTKEERWGSIWCSNFIDELLDWKEKTK